MIDHVVTSGTFTLDGQSFDVACNAMLPFFGLTMTLGAIANWGRQLH